MAHRRCIFQAFIFFFAIACFRERFSPERSFLNPLSFFFQDAALEVEFGILNVVSEPIPWESTPEVDSGVGFAQSLVRVT